jgi:hypothetical protein
MLKGLVCNTFPHLGTWICRAPATAHYLKLRRVMVPPAHYEHLLDVCFQMANCLMRGIPAFRLKELAGWLATVVWRQKGPRTPLAPSDSISHASPLSWLILLLVMSRGKGNPWGLCRRVMRGRGQGTYLLTLHKTRTHGNGSRVLPYLESHTFCTWFCLWDHVKWLRNEWDMMQTMFEAYLSHSSTVWHDLRVKIMHKLTGINMTM